MRILIVLPLIAIAAGCASKELIAKSSEYGVTHERIETEYGKFNVYEHPDDSRLAVSSTMAGALGQGIAKGLTFGAGNILPSEGSYQQAAEAYLAKHDVFAGCRITNGYLLQEPIYEFTYECDGGAG